MTEKRRFTAAELARAVRACLDAGMEVAEAVVDREGSIRIIAAQQVHSGTPVAHINPADLIDP